MKQECTNPVQKLKFFKQNITIICIIVLAIQVILFTKVQDVGREMQKNEETLMELRLKSDEALIDKTVRPQQRRILDAIRQSWIQYFNVNPDVELLIKNNEGHLIYASPSGETIDFDSSLMRRVKRPDNYYDIFDKISGELLAKQVRPQWDSLEIKKVIDIIAAPHKAFGSTGDVIIFDSYTGDMIVDNSEDCKDTPEVIGENGLRNIQLDHLHPNGANPKMMNKVIQEEMMWRHDTEYGDGMVYYFSEEEDFDNGTNANNFALYPFGLYEREFQEKVILPYETVGVEGEKMQITVIIGAQEQEIANGFKEVNEIAMKYSKSLHDQKYSFVLIPIISMSLCLILIVIIMFGFRISIYVTSQGCKAKELE